MHRIAIGTVAGLWLAAASLPALAQAQGQTTLSPAASELKAACASQIAAASAYEQTTTKTTPEAVDKEITEALEDIAKRSKSEIEGAQAQVNAQPQNGPAPYVAFARCAFGKRLEQLARTPTA
jgi:predicted aconitase